MIEVLLRKMPLFKGKQRLARLLLRSQINRSRDILVKGKYDCKYKIPNLREGIGFEIFINGIYESETIGLIAGELPMHANFLDIGANIGAVVLPVCKKRPDINAVAVEASRRVFQYLAYNVELNAVRNCQILNNAVSNSDGLSIEFFSPEELFGKGSMSPVFTQQAEKSSTITLDTITEQYVKGDVHLIKIDVEGYEYHAFKGGLRLLQSENAPDILFEFADWTERLANGTSPGDAQRLLLDCGYRLWKLDVDGRREPMISPLEKGSAMIWASKKK